MGRRRGGRGWGGLHKFVQCCEHTPSLTLTKLTHSHSHSYDSLTHSLTCTSYRTHSRIIQIDATAPQRGAANMDTYHSLHPLRLAGSP